MTAYGELGQDFDEQLEVRGRNAAAILATAQKYVVPVDMIYKSSGGAAPEPIVVTTEEDP